MKFSGLGILVILSMVLLQNSCTLNQKKDLWKEGELVTWKFSDQLIIKTKVGQRREHVDDNQFYEPESEYFIGQFPIHYEPEVISKLTEQQAFAMPAITTDPSIKLEFNLILNGSTVQATDKPIYLDDTLDHPDQVRVSISSSDIDSAYLTTKDKYLASLSHENQDYDKKLSNKYGMSCYQDQSKLTCFGDSSHDQVSGLIFSSEPNADIIRVVSTEPIYGKIDMEWYVHKDNLEQWQEIDKNIWRLLAAWNVSPINKNQALLNNLRGDLTTTEAKKSTTGEILTFIVNPELIVSVNKDATNPYDRSHPNIRHFLGQFTLDNMPKKQSIAKGNKAKKATTVNEPLEFVFLLNGLKDYHLSSYDTEPTTNQIKVRITNLSNIESSKLETATERVDYLLSIDVSILDKQSKFYKHGTECYKSENGLYCIGRTNRYKHPELLLQVSPNINEEVFLESYANTQMYGGLRVEWKATADSFKDWLEIDTAIWRLLDEINIAFSVQNSVQTPNEP